MPKVFNFEDLIKAPTEVLGKGCYKAKLKIGTTVTVKSLKDVKVSKKKFRGLFDELGKINHKNLLPLGAYCCHYYEKLLVYEYMLYALLHGARNGKKTRLNWDTRFGIALGVPRAIEYIHLQGPAISHGNIKSSNILLTTTLEARVADFLPDLIVQSEPNPRHIDGYCAPEVTNRRKGSQKADVYSFGVLLLELLTGKASIVKDEFTLEEVNLPRWILFVVEDELTSEVLELDLLRYENVEENLVRLLQITINCTAHDLRNRPSMAEARAQIEEFICCS